MNYNIIETREKLLELLPKNSIGAEIGVFKGDFSKIILEIVTPQLFYLIDPWEGIIESGDKNGNNIEYIQGHSYYSNNIIKDFLFLPQVKILKHYSDVINIFPDEYLDWIYIDGAHDYTTVKSDLISSYPKIKNGGHIIGHDYSQHMFPGLVNAVNEFCFENNLEISYLTQDGCPSYLIVKK
jgi:hypothetical protein